MAQGAKPEMLKEIKDRNIKRYNQKELMGFISQKWPKNSKKQQKYVSLSFMRRLFQPVEV